MDTNPRDDLSSKPNVLARLRWRARRGLLENDLVIERFFDRYEHQLTGDDIDTLMTLFEETDNDLLDIILDRRPLAEHLDKPGVHRVVQMLRSA